MEFYGSAPRFFIVGDCRKVGDLHGSNRMLKQAFDDIVIHYCHNVDFIISVNSF